MELKWLYIYLIVIGLAAGAGMIYSENQKTKRFETCIIATKDIEKCKNMEK